MAVRFAIEPEEEAGPQLGAIGIGPGDVRLRRHDPSAHRPRRRPRGVSDPRNVGLLRANSGARQGFAGRLNGYLPQRWPKGFDPKALVLDSGAYGPFARSKRLTADGAVVAVATPGHTPDHLSVIVEDGDKAIFIAGDASYSQATMLDGTIDGVSDDEGQAAATLAAIRAFAAAQPTIYLPTHDPDAARRLAGREMLALPCNECQ